MTAPSFKQPPHDLVSEAKRLHGLGFSLLPLRGKTPLVTFGTCSKLPLNVTVDRLLDGRADAVGIRLKDLLVVDIDTHDGTQKKEMEKRFGVTAVITRTPRGYHLYYLRGRGPVPNLKSEGLPVDVKTGGNAFVVAAGTMRVNGDKYVAIGQPLSRSILREHKHQVTVTPKTNATSERGGTFKRTYNGLVPKGHRHNHLISLAREYVEAVQSETELNKNLIAERDHACADPVTFSDDEVGKISAFFWKKRLENGLFSSKDSSFRMRRTALDCLNGNTDAIALLTILESQHGHTAGKKFSLDQAGMKRSGLINMGRDRFRAAVTALLEAGLMEVAKEYFAGSQKRQYRLRRAHSLGSNVVDLPR
ncbi:hypothetical protein SAMN05444004_12530 [Jannaschia faecimaris]|uniref:DNA primase/polymerase bifunctional N-terminal domain-containing protein n=2 Tax=Jannaschia faecimaris TaxID=1244108 RepID=A0A1H3UA97_9RHOB|nr:hypothetical protein SAMN05444004_12530 [Jannaschia faecimaris]